MTDQQKATTADELLDRAAEVLREAEFHLDSAPYDDERTAKRKANEVLAEYDRLRATPQPADVPQASPAQEDAPVADGTNWREVASSLNAALLSNDASHAEQARRIYIRALIAANRAPVANGTEGQPAMWISMDAAALLRMNIGAGKHALASVDVTCSFQPNDLHNTPIYLSAATDTPASAVAEPVAWRIEKSDGTGWELTTLPGIADHMKNNRLLNVEPLYAAPPPIARSDADEVSDGA